MARKRSTKEPDEPADPLAWMTPEQRERHRSLLAKLVVPPCPFGLGARFGVLYVTSDETAGVQTMVWQADTDDEEAEIRAFHDAAHGIGAFAKAVAPGKPMRRSTDEWALIRAVLAHRAEMTGYLVYADYLTEHDDPQGELIRASIERARTPKDDPAFPTLDERQNELVSEHGEHVYRGLTDLGLRPTISPTVPFAPWLWLSVERGVIEELAVDRPKLLPENADRLFAAAPFLRKLKFEKGHLDAAGLAKVKQLAQIEDLDLSNTELTGENLRALLRSKHLTGLKALDVGSNAIGDEGALALADWPGLAKLESLDVSGCGLSPEGVNALLEPAGIGNLTQLRIGRNDTGAFGAGLVIDSPRLKKLTHLELVGFEFPPVDLSLDFTSDATFLGSSAFAKTLRHLNLDSATFQPGAFEALALCALPALRWLKLDSVNLRFPAAGQLARASFTATLEELYLDNCHLGGGSANFFFQGRFPKLKTLDVSRNRIERYGAEALAENAKNFPALTTLRLWDNRLGAEAVARLAESKVLANVTDLDLNGNKIGPAGALALAKSKYLTKLTSLIVDEITVGKKGKKALLDRFGENVVSFR